MRDSLLTITKKWGRISASITCTKTHSRDRGRIKPKLSQIMDRGFPFSVKRRIRNQLRRRNKLSLKR